MTNKLIFYIHENTDLFEFGLLKGRFWGYTLEPSSTDR
jgi:hypothetical protein